MCDRDKVDCQHIAEPNQGRTEASGAPSETATSKGNWKKLLTMYGVMVLVSTIAIFLLEHATIFGAFRTAVIAAIGKTFAANWVSGLFE